MNRFKLAGVSLTMVLALAVASTAAFAAHPGKVVHPKKPVNAAVWGSLVSYTSSSAVISTANGDITVKLLPSTRYVTSDQAAAAQGLLDNDNVEALGRVHDGTVTAYTVRYDNVAFAITRVLRFEGKWAPSANATTLTITSGKRSHSFKLTTDTKYFQNGKATTAPDYAHSTHVVVLAREYTDNSWIASRVDVFVPKKK